MSKVNLIAENTAFLFIGKLASKLISLLSVILIARYLGESDYGKYSFVFAFVSFFSIISELGIYQILLRDVPRSPEKTGKLIGNAIIIKIILSVLAYILAVFSINIMGYPQETITAIQIAALSLLVDILNIYGVVYEANLKMKYSVFFFFVGHVLMLGLILLITYFDFGLNLVILSTMAGTVIQNILTYLSSKKYVKVEFEIDFNVCKNMIKDSLPLALSSVFTIIYYRIDMVMLSMMIGDAAVGVYSAAYRISETFLFIPGILMSSLFPLMSKFFEKSNETLAFSYEKSAKYLFSLALPMAVGTTILSDEIITAIYGDGFKGSIVALQILIWATAIIFINYATGSLYIAINKQRFTMFYTSMGAFVNILLNYILIPKYSYIGASTATVLTEFSILIITLYWMPSYIQKKRLIQNNFPSFAATIVMSMFLFCGLKNYFGLFAIIPSMIIYLVSFYLFKGLDIDDKMMLRKIFGKYIS